ncbi:hypothetical protein EDC61_1218 [Sulfuritortus calidifontis]|uniref:Uncharacterized protein n=1 Tax=Sulfuritortus calidifontis TaxID=1914471 RepID=A0A4R3JTW4_9PROT|nr:hypothetical protein [Sulfuritortus calidifontis]TCS69216.1 hypothetical protein EDC61_1218 [Sulfuritortus calidifontis]
MKPNLTTLPTEPVLNMPVSPSGGPVVACELDKACVQVDCEQLADEVADVLDESPDAPDYLLHYCGVDYLKQTSGTDRKK